MSVLSFCLLGNTFDVLRAIKVVVDSVDLVMNLGETCVSKQVTQRHVFQVKLVCALHIGDQLRHLASDPREIILRNITLKTKTVKDIFQTYNFDPLSFGYLMFHLYLDLITLCLQHANKVDVLLAELVAHKLPEAENRLEITVDPCFLPYFSDTGLLNTLTVLNEAPRQLPYVCVLPLLLDAQKFGFVFVKHEAAYSDVMGCEAWQAGL